MFTSMTGVVGPAGHAAQFEAEGGVTSGSAAERASLGLALVIGAPQLPIDEITVLLPIVSGDIVVAAPHVVCHGIANRIFEPGHLHVCNARFAAVDFKRHP